MNKIYEEMIEAGRALGKGVDVDVEFYMNQLESLTERRNYESKMLELPKRSRS